ncbi:unnamed protein product [Prorocentrum cordatum]|uniref:Uncharacterized protein n=1 Tax=Prorocentrum cordatum TaxID=2364126 RepID=A0ABN9WWB5_9DINO|nr:unnamed protein product [Polarella glacialis]
MRQRGGGGGACGNGRREQGRLAACIGKPSGSSLPSTTCRARAALPPALGGGGGRGRHRRRVSARLHARACWSDATDLHRRPHTEERPRRRALAVRTDGAACATREFAQLAQVPEQAGGDPAPQPAGWNTTNPKELMDAAALKAPTDGLRSVAPLPPLDGKKKRGG